MKDGNNRPLLTLSRDRLVERTCRLREGLTARFRRSLLPGLVGRNQTSDSSDATALPLHPEVPPRVAVPLDARPRVPSVAEAAHLRKAQPSRGAFASRHMHSPVPGDRRFAEAPE